MPPTIKFSRETIVNAALNLIRDKGIGFLTARSLGQYIGSSPRPIFTAFRNMDEMIDQVRVSAINCFHGFMRDEDGHTPRIKYYCSRLAHFALLEPNLYNFIFVSSSNNPQSGPGEMYSDLRTYFLLAVEEISSLYSLSHDEALVVANHVSLTAHALCSLITDHHVALTDQQIDTCLGRSLAGALLLAKSEISDICGSASQPDGLSEGDSAVAEYINRL